MYTARYGISVGVNPKTNAGLGVQRAGTSNQKAMRNEKALTKRLNLPPSEQASATSTVGEEVDNRALFPLINTHLDSNNEQLNSK